MLSGQKMLIGNSVEFHKYVYICWNSLHDVCMRRKWMHWPESTSIEIGETPLSNRSRIQRALFHFLKINVHWVSFHGNRIQTIVYDIRKFVY